MEEEDDEEKEEDKTVCPYILYYIMLVSLWFHACVLMVTCLCPHA